MTLNLVLRRAVGSDAGPVAEVWLRSFSEALPTVRRAHTDDEVRAWFREVVVPERETWAALVDGQAVGVMVLHDGEVDQLYLDPTFRGRGIGTYLLDLAKKRSPAGLALWTFQVNESARRFYRRHGFVETDRTDGRANEEHEPDLRLEWSPQH